MLKMLLVVLGVLTGITAAANAQEAEAAPSPYFDCPYINYFDSDCPQLRQLWEERELRRREQQEVGRTLPDAGGGGDVDEDEPGGMQPEDLGAKERYLLFPKEGVAPDTPELFLLLLAEPTLDNARRYVRWYMERTLRLEAVQELIQVAGRELEDELRGGKRR